MFDILEETMGVSVTLVLSRLVLPVTRLYLYGVNAQNQNGIVESSIGHQQTKTRSTLLHAIYFSPEMMSIEFFPSYSKLLAFQMLLDLMATIMLLYQFSLNHKLY